MNLTFDDGYQFGLGAFETLSLIEGRPVWLEAHEARLRRTLDWLGISLPVDWKEKLASYLAKDGGDKGVLKILASDHNLCFTSRRNPYEAMTSRPGFVLALSDIRRNESSPFVRHKTFNYGDSIVAKRQAIQKGIDEPIFCNTKGELAEGAVSNLFFIKMGSSIRRPSRPDSCRASSAPTSVLVMTSSKEPSCPMKYRPSTSVLLPIPSWASWPSANSASTPFPYRKKRRQPPSFKAMYRISSAPFRAPYKVSSWKALPSISFQVKV